MNALWKLLTVLLVKTFAAQGTIELDLDDTLFHRWGRNVCGAGWWRDAVRSTGKRTVCRCHRHVQAEMVRGRCFQHLRFK
jgi:transposase